MKKKIIIIIYIMLFTISICITSYFYVKQKQYTDKTNLKHYSSDQSFYLQNEKLYVKDNLSEEYFLVPGDFSQMSMVDYQDENYKSNLNTTGGVYFYYRTNNRTYLVRSDNLKDWTIKNIDIPINAKIKYIRISGNYGYIFYLAENNIGYILKTTTQGNYWNKVQTPFELNENCQLKFLNEFGMTSDGFLTVPNEDGSKCDLYSIDDNSEETFKKVDISKLLDKSSSELDYYHMPSYWNNTNSTNYLLLEVGKSKDDFDTQRFLSTSSSNTWITEKQYYINVKEEQDKDNATITKYNKMVDALDEAIFLKDFKNYSVNSNEIKISEEKAKEIAEYSFKEFAARITSEGIVDTVKEYINIEEVYLNNCFTRRYHEYDERYTNYKKRKAYVISKENDMGNGVQVYVDVTTGLIIGGTAFGD